DRGTVRSKRILLASRHPNCIGSWVVFLNRFRRDETMQSATFTESNLTRMDNSSSMKSNVRSSLKSRSYLPRSLKKVTRPAVSDEDEKKYVVGVICVMLMLLLVPALALMTYLIVSPTAFTDASIIGLPIS
ncbi:MAG: hypothetical protein ACF8AM_21840, partial [Rhodopirellula sp. JB055]